MGSLSWYLSNLKDFFHYLVPTRISPYLCFHKRRHNVGLFISYHLVQKPMICFSLWVLLLHCFSFTWSVRKVHWLPFDLIKHHSELIHISLLLRNLSQWLSEADWLHLLLASLMVVAIEYKSLFRLKVDDLWQLRR